MPSRSSPRVSGVTPLSERLISTLCSQIDWVRSMTKGSYFMTWVGKEVSGFGAACKAAGKGFDHPFQLDLGDLVERAEDEAVVVVLVLGRHRVPAAGGVQTRGLPQLLEIEDHLGTADTEVVRGLEE